MTDPRQTPTTPVLPVHPEDYGLHIAKLNESVARIEARVAQMERAVERIEKVGRDVERLVDLFQSAKGVLAAVKWLAGVGAAAAAIWAGVHWSR